MNLAVKVVNLYGEEVPDAYLLRVAGWTEEQYFEAAPESQIVEFEDGELIVHSPVNVRHQRIVRFLTFLLQGYIEAHDLGEVLNGPGVVRLRPDLDYEPDIYVVTKAQQDRLSPQYFAGVPALVIEVISPGTRNHDLRTKAAHYHEHTVPEYWAVDPEHTTLYHHLLPEEPSTSYRLASYTDGRLNSQAINGFWIDVDWLWQDSLPRQLACLECILHGAYR